MNTLFDTEDGSPVKIATREQVRELTEDFAFKEETVKRWTTEKAATVLTQCHKGRFKDLQHGSAKAHEQEPLAEVPFNPREIRARLDAVVCLHQDLAAGNIEHVLFSTVHAIYTFTNLEIVTYARLVALELSLDPVTREKLIAIEEPAAPAPTTTPEVQERPDDVCRTGTDSSVPDAPREDLGRTRS